MIPGACRNVRNKPATIQKGPNNLWAMHKKIDLIINYQNYRHHYAMFQLSMMKTNLTAKTVRLVRQAAVSQTSKAAAHLVLLFQRQRKAVDDGPQDF